MTIKELIIKLSDYPQDMRVFTADGRYLNEISANTNFEIYQGNNNEWYRDNGVVLGEDILTIGTES
jgi:hypothetical protein